MNLQPKQREALDALLSGASMTEAAALAGVHRATLHNWCRDNTFFRAALRDAQSQQAGIVQDGLRASASKALETIESIMTDPEAPAAVRLRAATLIIQAVSKDPYTQPAEPRLTTAAVDNIIEAAAQVGAEEQALRAGLANSGSSTQPQPKPEPVPESEPQVARSAPCPCGSGEKFKRCCGRGAPGVVNQARAA